MNSKTTSVLFLVVSLASVVPLIGQELGTHEDSNGRTTQFNRDIRPLLADRCFACHGPDSETVAADLRFDQRSDAVDSGAIVPGKPDESELIRRIFSQDEDEQMPPPDSNKELSKSERELFRRWIAEGAEYEKHWAYTPLKSPPLPKFEGLPEDHWVTVWPQNSIDLLVAEPLIAKGLQPNPQADRVTLIRRLSFDLNGLPPSHAEVEDFVRDSSPDAYEKLVDRLLASPRFGERMAIYWLDLVRYADTVGYHGDQDISQSPYRDYVIQAFNDNMPYDQFVREQLAGDLLPNSTRQQRIASGYNRLNQTTEEGGSQPKEYLAIYFADRVRNVSQVFMGATVGCAQCHDHKFDPYTMKDFYSLGAFFADLEERGVYSARSRPPMISVPTAEEEKQLESLEQQIVAGRQALERVQERVLAEQAEWERVTIADLGQRPKPLEHVWLGSGQNPAGKRSGDWNLVNSPDAEQAPDRKSRVQKSGGLVQHFFDDSPSGITVEENTQFFVWAYLDPSNPPSALMMQLNNGNWEHRGVWGSDQINFGRKNKSWAGYFRYGKLPETGRWVRLDVKAKDVGLSQGAKVDGMAFTQFGGTVFWGPAGWIADDSVPVAVREALMVEKQHRNESQAETIRKWYLANSSEMKQARDAIARLEADKKRRVDSMTKTVVSKSTKPREIRILPRGNWMDDSGPVVEPAIPEFLGKLEVDGQRATRLDFADWLCEPDNVLTSRTMVNRFWFMMFGRGICTSVDDLGTQGTYPSNPALLDHLAVQFVESGWDIKKTLKSIVMSSTYRQSSLATPSQLEADLANDLFARQGRYRIDAEMIRDTALAISGLLVEETGGRSVKPYQPPGYYAQLNFPTRKYQSDTGPNQYRRGVYTHWQRTFLHPMLKAFDAPSREEGTCSRARSNTPLQSLTLLNDPTFVEAARVYAVRVMNEGGDSVDERISWAYRNAVSREPDRAILEVIKNVHAKHVAQYRADRESAKKLVEIGLAPLPAEIDVAELAAWTSVARIILNLHELTTRY